MLVVISDVVSENIVSDGAEERGLATELCTCDRLVAALTAMTRLKITLNRFTWLRK